EPRDTAPRVVRGWHQEAPALCPDHCRGALPPTNVLVVLFQRGSSFHQSRPRWVVVKLTVRVVPSPHPLNHLEARTWFRGPRACRQPTSERGIVARPPRDPSANLPLQADRALAPHFVLRSVPAAERQDVIRTKATRAA